MSISFCFVEPTVKFVYLKWIEPLLKFFLVYHDQLPSTSLFPSLILLCPFLTVSGCRSVVSFPLPAFSPSCWPLVKSAALQESAHCQKVNQRPHLFSDIYGRDCNIWWVYQLRHIFQRSLILSQFEPFNFGPFEKRIWSLRECNLRSRESSNLNSSGC